MRFGLTLVSLLLGGALTASAATQTIVIDDTTPGVIWDGIVDGFPMLSPHDGNGDVQGNPLSVARQGDVTEVRSIMEFPLAAFAGENIVSATLTFNVDDVISTLGPGTAFTGEAASTILVHFYPADGEALLADYKRTEETPVAVSTGPTITDASLKQTGAKVFTIDVRERLVAALTAGTPFLGALWRTNDSPTATSIDDGRNGNMPGEGGETSAGSRQPFLTVEFGDPTPVCTTDPECDDGNACTADTCDAVQGCLHAPAREGEVCAGTGCTADGVCLAGVCAGTPIEGPCDDGNACTRNDICNAGACGGDPLCGDGAVDAACGETCDDGNTAVADGCSPACLPDTLPGKGKKPCLLELAFGHPVRDSAGTVMSPQTCTDNDPACDDDPTPDTCGFVVAACLGRATATCAAVTTVAPIVVSPNRSRKQRPNRDRLDASLAGLSAPSCSTPVRIDVPVRRRGAKVRAGKAKLVLRAKAPGVGRDKDAVSLVCQPAS
ncbi:MAG TPA: hypothetical protein VGR62_23670 [Candidatus Binatia bacterium]|jgi:cysteine-rich repeat protein|nr:hypothetical protein [Candidatus Binatia bacterium]